MKRLALQLMHGCGVFALARAMSAGMGRILMYHNFCGSDETDPRAVSPSALRAQLEYLRRHFQVVPLAHMLDQVGSGNPLDRRSVVLTIDDGRRSCYEFLFPILKQFRLPATFFVVSSFIRGDDWIWTDKVLWLSEQPRPHSELAPDRIDGYFTLLNQLRPEERNRRMATLADAMRVAIPKEPPHKYSPCSWRELREMADSGLVEVGSHTVSHPILASVTDEESWTELTLSRAHIEEGIGRKVNSFCFPNGKPGDYRQSQLHQLNHAGYTSAVVTRFGMVGPRANPYELPRVGIAGTTDPLTFAKHLDGAEYYQARLQGSLM